jgi:hypothetical protein
MMRVLLHPLRMMTVSAAVLLLAACSLKMGKGPGPADAVPPAAAGPIITEMKHQETPAVAAVEIDDLLRIPQEFDGLAAAAGDRLVITQPCQEQLMEEFKVRFFAPWSLTGPAHDPAEARDFMRQEGLATWYGPNKRKIPTQLTQGLLGNCALESFPSRNDCAISVAPGHLRGLPTHLPFYQRADDYPFDMLSYPQVKLNEPLRVLHTSRDGVWLFVETGYTNGWIEARDVALVDRDFMQSWMQAPHLVVVRDYAPVPDGRGVGVFRSKVGTLLPMLRSDEDGWEVAVASAGEGGRAQSRPVRLPRATAMRFPLEFTRENIALVGNQLLGEPYGWGEIYDLRDCSAMLRDFYLSFGIWLPRTSADQIASVPKRIALAQRTPSLKEEMIRNEGIPFLTLLYKPGHIMLYVGVDNEGRPLLFHNAWSVRLTERGAEDTKGNKGSVGGVGGVGGRGERTQIIGIAGITSLEPGKELGLVPGSSLLEKLTELGTITNRCQEPAAPNPTHK